MDKRLKIISINMNGILTKLTELKELINKHKPDIILAQETLLKNRHSLKLPNMTIYRTDREGKRGGGTAIFIKRSIKHHETQLDLDNKLIETTAIRIHTNRGHIKIVSAYIPPTADTTIKDLNELLGTNEPTIIMGDLNAKHQDWGCRVTNNRGRKLHTSLNSHKNAHLTAPDEYTHIDTHGNLDILDVMISINIGRTNHIHTLEDIGSDHIPVTTTLTYEPNIYEGNPPPKLNNYSWDTFRTVLNSTLQNDKLTTKTDEELETASTHLTHSIQTALEQAKTPNNAAHAHRTEHIPERILTLIRRKHRLIKLDKLQQSRDNRTEINQLIKDIKQELKAHRSQEFDKFVNKFTQHKDTQKIHKIPRILRAKPKTIGRLTDGTNTAETSTDKANMIAEKLKTQFTPNKLRNQATNLKIVYSNAYTDIVPPQNVNNIEDTKRRIKQHIKQLKDHSAPGLDGIPNFALKRLTTKAIDYMAALFTNCLNSCYFPQNYKTAKIVPILKKGKPRTNPESYRPISLLSTTSKILERIIKDDILTQLHDKNILTNAQAGFRPEHSTTDQLWRLNAIIRQFNERKKGTAALFVDLEKAFDKVSHQALVHKLLTYDFHINTVKMIKHYLHQRQYVVHIENTNSHTQPMTSGVPQGSALGPTLYIIFYNDLTEHINHNNLALYADDTTIFVPARNIRDRFSALQNLTNTLTKYYDEWGMKANENKTELVDFTKKTSRTRRVNTYTIKLNGKHIRPKRHAKYLGLTLDSRLTYNKSVTDIRNRAGAAFKTLTPLFKSKSLTIKTKTALYKTYVRPILLYGAEIHATGPDTTTKRLTAKYNGHLRRIYKWNFEPPDSTYVKKRNDAIRQELNMEDLTLVIQYRTQKHRLRINTHTNTLLRQSNNTH